VDSLSRFSAQMLQNWLIHSELNILKFCPFTIPSFLTIICQSLDEFVVTIKYFHKIKMIVLTKIAVALDANKKQTPEIMFCLVSVDVMLVYFNSFGALLKMSDTKIVCNMIHMNYLRLNVLR
jgi:hypothetical protein